MAPPSAVRVWIRSRTTSTREAQTPDWGTHGLYWHFVLPCDFTRMGPPIHSASAATECGARSMTDTSTDAAPIPVLAARIARRRAAGYTAHKGLLGRLGPGLITGASDDDPSGTA